VCLDNDGERLTVSVSDKGCGFDRERMDQLNGTRSGFGLLSIRERAKSVGGAFDIISSPGAGSCFTISVPFRISKPYLGAVSFSDAAGEPAHTGETGRDIRVVFVDDHEVIRKALINLVSGTTGIRVAGEASNGAEAVDLVRRTRPDVVVMDVSMPVMDGLQATRLLKDEQPGLRIIGLSMIEDEYIARDMRRAGAETYLTKAVSSTDLLKAIYGLADDV
jgi:CheY-like chemotaxis protein